LRNVPYFCDAVPDHRVYCFSEGAEWRFVKTPEVQLRSPLNR